jgi:sugar phosphate isomerase/epimerase
MERRKSVDEVKRWMERAAQCGATSARANTGGAPGQEFDLAATADCFHQLAEFGKQLGVKILVENHGGHSSLPDNVVAIVKAVDSPWCRTAPDFGNMPPGKDESYREQMLKMMFPYAHLASAKGKWFDDQDRHVPYDIGQCVRIGESCGFQGVYSAEYFDGKGRPFDPVRVALLIIRSVADAL